MRDANHLISDNEPQTPKTPERYNWHFTEFMMKKQQIKLFEDKKVRVAWDDEKEEWYFSIVNVCEVLTDSDYQAARKYWKVLKGRLKKKGNGGRFPTTRRN